MAEKFCRNFGSGPHQLKIGKSFDRKDKSVFHSIRLVAEEGGKITLNLVQI